MDNRQDETENLRPFLLKRLSNKSAGKIDSLKEEAARIAENARGRIDNYRRETEENLRRKEAELDALREELQKREEELNRREEKIGSRITDEGWDQGYQDGLGAGREDGFEEGKREALAHWETESADVRAEKTAEWVKERLPLVESVTQQLCGVRQTLLSYWEKNILQIAAAIAHQTIARELPKMNDVPVDLLREALELAVGCASVKIRMHPDDLKELRGAVETLLKSFSQITSAELIEDTRVDRGGCVLESSLGTIDQRLESRLERIISELSR